MPETANGSAGLSLPSHWGPDPSGARFEVAIRIARYRASGSVELLVFHEDAGLSAVVMPDRLRVDSHISPPRPAPP
ncbi:hypothetical protein [Rhodoferax ferrireducens]|uniref:hypothetical protein n=1 Tax=Rhodoferax ferrireducens TaxID=192843 RepID=UPI00130020A2|nr:hypothetical protein [Rhodoferax ferrireducens]